MYAVKTRACTSRCDTHHFRTRSSSLSPTLPLPSALYPVVMLHATRALPTRTFPSWRRALLTCLSVLFPLSILFLVYCTPPRAAREGRRRRSPDPSLPLGLVQGIGIRFRQAQVRLVSLLGRRIHGQLTVACFSICSCLYIIPFPFVILLASFAYTCRIKYPCTVSLQARVVRRGPYECPRNSRVEVAAVSQLVNSSKVHRI